MWSNKRGCVAMRLDELGAKMFCASISAFSSKYRRLLQLVAFSFMSSCSSPTTPTMNPSCAAVNMSKRCDSVVMFMSNRCDSCAFLKSSRNLRAYALCEGFDEGAVANRLSFANLDTGVRMFLGGCSGLSVVIPVLLFPRLRFFARDSGELLSISTSSVDRSKFKCSPFDQLIFNG